MTESCHLPRKYELCSEEPRLLVGPLGELRSADSAREAEVVPDERTCAGLPADHVPLDDQGPQPLRSRVNRRREPGGPAADHRHVTGQLVRVLTDGVHDLRVRRVGEHRSVEQEDGRQRREFDAVLLAESLGHRGRGVVEPVGNPVAIEQLADLIRARGKLITDDVDQLHSRPVDPRPFRQELAHQRIQMDFGGRPGLVEVIVQLAQRAALQDGGRGRVVTPGDEQRALRHGLDGADPPEEFVARHLGHPLIRDDQGNFLAVLLDLGDGVQSGGRGEVGHDAVVPAEPPRQGVEHRGQRSRLVVDHHDHRSLCHRRSSLALPVLEW